MPGSIQVSVLDFKELPSSSNSVKVSLGKVEHEARDKGTFLFPLTNLRDNLIITIQDSDGIQVSRSGVRTTSIIEKGTWDDLFPIEGGGAIHMKLQFILSDEERNRIRSMREAAMKKKQAEILGSSLRKAETAKSLASSLHTHEVSDVLTATSSQDFQGSSFNGDLLKGSLLTPLDDHTSVKAAESSGGMKEEAFDGQAFTNATDKREETSLFPTTETTHLKPLVENSKSQPSLTELANKNEAATTKLSDDLPEKLDKQSLEEKNPTDVKITKDESTSTPLLQETELNSYKNIEILLQDGIRKKAVLEEFKTGALIKKNRAAESNPSEKNNLDEQNLEEKIPSNVMKTSKERKASALPPETKVNMIKKNEIQFLQAGVSKRLQEASFQGVGSSRSTIAEKMKLFSPMLASEPDKESPPQKTPRNIKKMISAFESSISQDRAPLKPLGSKFCRVGSVRFLKNNAVDDSSEKSESSQEKVKNTETAGSTRLRNSFSTGDLRKELGNIISKGEQVGFDDDFVGPCESNMLSQEKETTGKEKLPIDSTAVARISINKHEKVSVKETNMMDLSSLPQDHNNSENTASFLKTNSKEQQKSHEADSMVFGRMPPDDKQSNTLHAIKAQVDSKIKEREHQEKATVSIPESIAKGEVHLRSDVIVKQGEEQDHVSGSQGPEKTDEEASNGSLGQVIKIALVVGFGVLVLFFRQRESGKNKQQENNRGLKNQVFMKKRGPFEEQRMKVGVLKRS